VRDNTFPASKDAPQGRTASPRPAQPTAGLRRVATASTPVGWPWPVRHGPEPSHRCEARSPVASSPPTNIAAPAGRTTTRTTAVDGARH
jgi:hypothetical protein